MLITRINLMKLLLLLGCHILTISAAGYGPALKPTVGEIWPKPQTQTSSGQYRALDPNNFEFVITNKNCNILQKAIQRYTKIIKDSALGYNRAPASPTIGQVTKISIDLSNKCETWPSLDMDESYQVSGTGRIVANSIWGILRGLETFAQLLVPMPNGLLRLLDTEINDWPRFKYRGLMLDSARHFISKAKILKLIEGMSYDKMNAFHWHISDDSAFPYNSTTYPELAQKGAYRYDLTYSPADVVEIVEFARVRGVRVIAEFDTPAHASSWGLSHPEVLTECKNGEIIGPFNPTLETTFTFLDNFFSEIRSLFKDGYLHLGGDEVDSECWETNQQIQNYLKDKGLDNGDVPYMYLERFSAMIAQKGWKQMIWQEALTELSVMEWPAGTIGQVWYNSANVIPEITKRNIDVITSEGWYLYVLDTGGDWWKFYNVEPTNFAQTDAQKQRIIGGEACLWSEFINEHNVLPTTFPRASAIAERLWSAQTQTDGDEAKLRLEEHNCRLLWRGIEARPANDYGLC